MSSHQTRRLIYTLAHLYRQTLVANYSNSNFTTCTINFYLSVLIIRCSVWRQRLVTTTLFFFLLFFFLLLVGYFHLKTHKTCVLLWKLSCWTKSVSIINLCLPQNLFPAIIQNPMEKSHWLFGEGTRTMPTSEKTCHTCSTPSANVSLLIHFIKIANTVLNIMHV